MPACAATFFTLGWIAERYPAMIRRIVDGGHELASHGYEHCRATDQGYGQFLADIRLAKAVLEDTSCCPVKGYRAPSFSIGPRNQWAFECIAEAGYRYSSSVYPIRHDHYGAPDAPRFAHEASKGLLELPITTVRLLHANWPAGGGGYFRLLPYDVSRWSLRRVNAVDRQPALFYFHPWELDPEQPRVQGPSRKARFRHYLNLTRMVPRMRRLLTRFQMGSRRPRVPGGPRLMGSAALAEVTRDTVTHDGARVRARRYRFVGCFRRPLP